MLKVFNINQSEEWDSTVRSFCRYDVYWLSGYVKAFQIHGDGEPLLIYIENGDARGINAVMKRDVSRDPHFSGKIPENEYFDFATPYGYGGWIIEGGDPKDLFSEYGDWCRENGIVSEFFRFHPVMENHMQNTEGCTVVGLGNTVTMDLSSPQIIWDNLISKNRNMIRKAEKNGVEVKFGRSPELFCEFRNIYNQTMDKDNADNYYYFGVAFYDSIYKDLADNALIFYAEYEGKIIASSIMLVCDKKMNYHLSGSLKEYSHLAPTNLILYKAAMWGCENGCSALYLGGGVGSSEDGLFKFKKAFFRGDDLKRFYIGKKTYDIEKYNELMKIRGIENAGFFPEYRA